MKHSHATSSTPANRHTIIPKNTLFILSPILISSPIGKKPRHSTIKYGNINIIGMALKNFKYPYHTFRSALFHALSSYFLFSISRCVLNQAEKVLKIFETTKYKITIFLNIIYKVCRTATQCVSYSDTLLHLKPLIINIRLIILSMYSHKIL